MAVAMGVRARARARVRALGLRARVHFPSMHGCTLKARTGCRTYPRFLRLSRGTHEPFNRHVTVVFQSLVL